MENLNNSYRYNPSGQINIDSVRIGKDTSATNVPQRFTIGQNDTVPMILDRIRAATGGNGLAGLFDNRFNNIEFTFRNYAGETITVIVDKDKPTIEKIGDRYFACGEVSGGKGLSFKTLAAAQEFEKAILENKPVSTDFLKKSGISTKEFESFAYDLSAQYSQKTNASPQDRIALRGLLGTVNQLKIQTATALEINSKVFSSRLNQLWTVLGQLDTSQNTEFDEVKTVMALLKDFSLQKTPTNISNFFSDFQLEYRDLLKPEMKLLLSNYLSGVQVDNRGQRQDLFNSCMDQLFMSTSVTDKQQDFANLCFSESLMDSMGYLAKTVIQQDVAVLANMIDLLTAGDRSPLEKPAQVAITNILSEVLKTSLNFSAAFSVDRTGDAGNQLNRYEAQMLPLQIELSNAMRTGDTRALSKYMSKESLDNLNIALRSLTPEVRNSLNSLVDKCTRDITREINLLKLGYIKEAPADVINRIIKDNGKELGRCIYLAAKTNATTPYLKASFDIQDRLYNKDNQFFRWAAVERAQNTRTTLEIAASLALTVATVATAGALAPASGGVLAAMTSGRVIATAAIGGTASFFAKEGIASIYSDSLYQKPDLVAAQLIGRTLAGILKESIYMYGATIGGQGAKAFAQTAKETATGQIKALIKTIALDIGESSVSTLTARTVDLTEKIFEKILLGEDIDWNAFLKDTKDELGMALLMSVAGNLAGAGLEQGVKGLKIIYRDAMALRFNQIGEALEIRSTGGSMASGLRKLGDKPSSFIFKTTNEAKTRQQEFVAVKLRGEAEPRIFWGDEFSVNFDPGKLPPGFTIEEVYHGGPHTGISMEDQAFYKMLNKDIPIYHVDTMGNGSVTIYHSKGLGKDLSEPSRLASTATLTKELPTTKLFGPSELNPYHHAYFPDKLELWFKETPVFKGSMGAAGDSNALMREADTIFKEYKFTYAAREKDFQIQLAKAKETVDHLGRPRVPDTAAIKRMETDFLLKQQAFTAWTELRPSDINNCYTNKTAKLIFANARNEQIFYARDSLDKLLGKVDESYSAMLAKAPTAITNKKSSFDVGSIFNAAGGLETSLSKQLEYMLQSPDLFTGDQFDKIIRQIRNASRLKNSMGDELVKRGFDLAAQMTYRSGNAKF